MRIGELGDWEFEVPTTGSKILPPAARAWDALSSQGYSFKESVADLVDNSVDAGADEVVIHFLRDGDRLVSLVVADDGCGMDEAALDVAMTVGGRQGYRTGSLGMFGTGLKSASLSQASSVTVVSMTGLGGGAGRRWVMDHARSDHRCDIVEPLYAQTLLERYRERPIAAHGTIVRWDQVKDFPESGEEGQTDRYLSRLLPALQRHLGLYLHRFLERSDFELHITVEDVRTRTVYYHDSVVPLDPFDYPSSGALGYPRRFAAEVADVGSVVLTAHVWPPKSNLPQYKSIGPVLDRQGLYLYRNDRLVQAGGWNGLRQTEPHLALARVSVDLPAGHDDVFRLTVKKSGVETSPAFAMAVRRAVAEDGTEFDAYLRVTETTYREAKKHGPARREKAVAAGSGIDPAIKHSLENELDYVGGSQTLAFRWTDLDGEELFEVDRGESTVWLNARYRKLITGEHHGGLNDAPLVKTLLYLLFYSGGIFTSERLGPRVKDNLDLWQTVISAAVRAELGRGPSNG
jgi:hypothetical protein